MSLDLRFEWQDDPVVPVPLVKPSLQQQAHADAIISRILSLEEAMRSRARKALTEGSSLVTLSWKDDRWVVSATSDETPDIVPVVELVCLTALGLAGEKV